MIQKYDKKYYPVIFDGFNLLIILNLTEYV